MPSVRGLTQNGNRSRAGEDVAIARGCKAMSHESAVRVHARYGRTNRGVLREERAADGSREAMVGNQGRRRLRLQSARTVRRNCFRIARTRLRTRFGVSVAV